MPVLKTSELLTYRNPNAPHYERLIRKARLGSGTLNTPYIPRFASITEKHPVLHEFLRGKLTGKILVDLGCGSEISRQTTIKLATALGVKHLVLTDFANVLSESEFEINGMRVSLLTKDMLSLVVLLPSNSVSFLLSGIDRDIASNAEHNLVLAREMYRATEHRGIVLTYQLETETREIRFFLPEVGYSKLPAEILDKPTEMMIKMIEIYEK